MLSPRENPFSSHRVECLKYRFPGFSLTENISKLELQNWRGAIVGPHGSGKTTLLLELRQVLQSQLVGQRQIRLWFVPRDHMQRIVEWTRLVDEVGPTDILLIDGIERLSWLRRVQLLGLIPQSRARARRFTSSVIATTHRRLLGLRTWLQNSTSQEVMQELLLELYPAASTQLISRSQQLFVKNRGNIRDVFWQLYNEVSDCG
jgi:ABC-type cobalamin/Fe3+-siderophores transport system ATPase subunit